MKSGKILKTASVFALTGVLFMSSALSVEACTTILVGKDASKNGSTMVARNEDMGSAWTKRFYVREANENDSEFVSKGNGFSIELPKEHLKYTATPEWDTSEGLYEESGINSKNVAMSATESTTIKESVLELDPLVEDGIAEDAIQTVVLPYINSALEGVERLGKIVEEYGTAEMNGMAFSDNEDIWYMDTITGHHWVAVRVPDDSFAVIANTLSIQEFDWDDSDNFLYSENLKEFITDNDLVDDIDNMSIREIFADTESDAEYNLPRTLHGQNMLMESDNKIDGEDFKLFLKPDKQIEVQDVADVLGSHFEDTDYDTFGDKESDKYRPICVERTMESHILQIRNDVSEEISAIHWLALGLPDTSSYIPFYSGITDTPIEYQIGNDVPDENSAYWTYRKTTAFTNPYHEEFKTEAVQPVKDKVWKRMNESVVAVDKEAEEMIKKDAEGLGDYLNQKTQEMSQYSMKEYKKLNNDLIIRLTEKTNIAHDEDL